jgi:hypothetical protein
VSAVQISANRRTAFLLAQALNHPGTYEGIQVKVVSRYQKEQTGNSNGGEVLMMKTLR